MFICHIYLPYGGLTCSNKLTFNLKLQKLKKLLLFCKPVMVSCGDKSLPHTKPVYMLLIQALRPEFSKLLLEKYSFCEYSIPSC